MSYVVEALNVDHRWLPWDETRFLYREAAYEEMLWLASVNPEEIELRISKSNDLPTHLGFHSRSIA